MKRSNHQTLTAADFLYTNDRRFFALLGEGMEEWGASELQELGAEEIQGGYRGFHFRAEPRTLYQILYGTRLFSRVLAPLTRFDCHSARYLHRRAYAVEWETLFGLDQTFAVQAITSNSAIRHSRYAALTLKDAVADRFRDRTNARPNVDARHPDISLHLYIHNNQATLSLDLAGGSLHRRGYRAESVEAPMQETLAAAILRATGWRGERRLIDPFCGSGTLLCEAWMAACNIPAGYLRESYGVQRLPDFDATLWQDVKAGMDGRIRLLESGVVAGSDIDSHAVQAARTNLGLLPGGDRVDVQRADVTDLRQPGEALIVTNPPHGLRLGSRTESAALLKHFGDVLKQHCTGAEAFVYCSDKALVKTLGLKPSAQYPLRSGGQDGRLCRYELFAGPADQRATSSTSNSPGIAD